MDFVSSSSETNPPTFKRARDGSAFTRCEACKKDIPVAVADMHDCQRHGKKVKDPNQPKREELRNKSKIDRLSALPDNILTCNILSRLALKDVVRTSVLSTRWRFIWKQIPHLDFSEEFFKSLKSFDSWHQEVKYINDIIDSILQHHSEHIERFSIHVTFSQDILERLHIEQWVHHAALKEVKHISLKNYMELYCTSHSIIDIPPSLFACRLLRDLELHNFRFTGIPTEFDGFCSLQSCSLSQLQDLMDDGLEQLIRLCPLLHKLVLSECSQLDILKIHAPNLNFLKIDGFCDMVFLTGDCPQLVELAIDSCVFFHDLLFHRLHTSDVRIPKEHPMLNSLRKLSVTACIEVSGLTLLPTLGYFPNLEQVHFQIFEDGYYPKQISENDQYRNPQKRAIGETVADAAFPSLMKAHLDISSAMKKKEAIILVFLLNNAPSLNTLTVSLPYCPSNTHDKEFRNKVLDLQQMYEKVDIRMEIDEYRRDAICRGTNDEQCHRSYEHSSSFESSDDDDFGSDDDALNEFKRFYADYSKYLSCEFH